MATLRAAPTRHRHTEQFSGILTKQHLPGLDLKREGGMGKNTAQNSKQATTPRQNVYTCTRLSISGQFFIHTFQSDQSLPRAHGFILCTACGSVALLHAARVFDYFVAIQIAFMHNQSQITETISRYRFRKGKLIITCV